MTFDIIELNPTVEALKELAIKYQGLSINGIEDKEGYEAVKKARIELKSTRVEITKKGKELRDDANKFAKAVIEKEKELIGYIEPMERDLEAKQKEIDELKEIEKRKEQLYSRRQRLSEIGVELKDDDILKFDDQQFYDFIQDQKAEKLRLEQEKFEADKKAFEEEKLRAEREKEIEKAKKEAEEKAMVEAEAKAKKQAEEAEARHQAEIRRIKEQAEAKEKAEKEAQEKAILEAQKKKEAEEKDVKFQAWKDGQGYNDDQFIILEKNGIKVMYKQVSTFSF